MSILLSQFVPPSPSPSVSTSWFSTPCLHSFPANRFISLQGHHHPDSKTKDTTHTKKKRKKEKANITDEHRSKNPWQNSCKQNPATHLKDDTPWSSGFSLGEAIISQSASWTLPLASPLDSSVSKCCPQVFLLTDTLPLDAPNHVFNAHLYDLDFSTYTAQPR